MKKYIKYVITIIIVVILLTFFTLLLSPKYMTDIKDGALISEYYQQDKNHDIIFLGDCEVYEAFSPKVLWEEYGINSFIRGSAQQLVWQSYYLLKETLKYEKPQAIVFNVLSLHYNEPQKEAYNRMTIDGMRLSWEKFESIRASKMNDEHIIEYLFPILRYHSRWKELNIDDIKYLFKKEMVSDNGYLMDVNIRPAGFIPKGKPLGNYDFGDNAMEYLDKMRILCDENGVELILVKAPFLYPYWYPEWNDNIKKYAEKYNLKYYNFLDNIDEIGLDYDKDTYDKGLHLNLYGVEKLSFYFGEILQDNIDIRDHSSDVKLQKKWNKKIAIYNNRRKELEEKRVIDDK